MPTLPTNTKCQSLGCKNNKARLSSFCTEHGGRDTYTAPKTKARAEFNNMYASAAWKSIRQTQLSKQPLCQACLDRGIVTPAVQVDHIFPWSYIGKEAFYQNIYQSLCTPCHSHKTSLESQGVFRHYNAPQKDYRLSDYRRVIGGTRGD